MGLIFSCLGIFVSGYFMKRAKIQPKGAILMILFGNIVTVISLLIFMFLGCENVTFAGGELTHSGYCLYANALMVLLIS